MEQITDENASATAELERIGAEHVHHSAESVGLPPRLELIHIQKNTGSLLEHLAMDANISWGVCHFNFPWKPRSPFRDCPPLRDRSKRNKTTFWHYPLQQLKKESKRNLRIFPYDNLLNKSHVSRPKKYFVVVRNPYTRLISLFYQRHQGNKKKSLTKSQNSPKYLNTWLQKVIQDASYVGKFDLAIPL
jgi:Sulfotransferase family